MEPTASGVVPSRVQPLTIEYARQEVGGLKRAYDLLRFLSTLALLSGFCVGSCFLIIGGPDQLFSWIVHIGVYGITWFYAAVCEIAGVKLWGRSGRKQMCLNVIAGVGLIVIGCAPPFFVFLRDEHAWAYLLFGSAFACLAFTSWRHVLLYRELAALFRQAGQNGLSTNLTGLGWTKSVYETIWLSCCALPLVLRSATLVAEDFGVNLRLASDLLIYPAFGALFGCIGFAGIWIWMMIVHSACLSAARRTLRNNPQ